MGEAIAASLVGRGDEVVCTARTELTRSRIAGEYAGIAVAADNAEAVADADMVVLAVKPKVAPGVISEISGSLKRGAIVASVVAELSISELSEALDAAGRGIEVVRVIPNTAIRKGESVTFIAHASDCRPETVALVEGIFNLSGVAMLVSESEMPVCTALASCGIAFFLRFIRAAAEGAVELGLPAARATRIAALTARGSAAVLADGNHPEAEIDKVTTAGGITIRGLNAMEERGLTAAVIAGLKATCGK